jgi:hypothetical protein
VLRTPWLLLLPLATSGTGGMVLIVLAETGLLLAAGAFIAAGGVLAGLTGLRTAIGVGAIACLASAFVLPWRDVSARRWSSSPA